MSLRLSGNAKYWEGRAEEAASCYGALLRAAKEPSALVLRNRAAALCALGRHPAALEECERAALLEPDSSDTWIWLGALLTLLGRRPDALARLPAAAASLRASAPDAASRIDAYLAYLKSVSTLQGVFLNLLFF
jgi:tetratricopeptide (TPR) repeat protein